MLQFPYYFLEFYMNNEAEYEALITSLELAIPLGIKDMSIYRDSQLMVNQIVGSYKIL